MASERGSTVVVVLTVLVFAFRPLRRVMSVGLVVRVSTRPLLRRVCILRVSVGGLFDLIECNEVDELEVVDDDGIVCVFI